MLNPHAYNYPKTVIQIMKPLISIIIPVFCISEQTLSRAIESALAQSFDDIEIILVDDSPVDRSCEAIIIPYEQRDKRIKYVSHAANLGTLEARRTGLLNASGKYIMPLDADDELEKETCLIMYNTARKNKADIVQCAASVIGIENMPQRKRAGLLRCENDFTLGLLINEEIKNDCFLNAGHNKFIWSKLIKADIYRKAFSEIPEVYCVLTEDMLQYFFITVFAKRYFGIPDKLYRYHIYDGITVPRKEYNIEQWSNLCTNSNVYKIILEWIKRAGVASEVEPEVLKIMFSEIHKGLGIIQKQIREDMRPRAREIYDEAWGAGLVKRVEDKMPAKNEAEDDMIT